MTAGASHRGPPGDEEGTMHRTIPPTGRRLFQLLLLSAVAAVPGAGCGRATPGVKVTEITGVIGTRYHSGEMAFSPDGKTLALPIYDGTVELWSLETGKATVLASPFEKGSVPAHHIAFSDDGRTLAVVYPRRRVALWDVPTRKERNHIPIARGTWVAALAFADGDRTLVTVTSDGSIQNEREETSTRWDFSAVRWEVSTRRWLGDAVFDPFLAFVALAPDGRHAVFRDEDWYGVYDLATAAKLFGLDNSGSVYGHGSYIFSEDGATLVCYNRTRLSLLEVPSAKERKRFAFDLPTLDDLAQLSLSSDARLLAVGGLAGEGDVGLVSLESGKVLGTVECAPPGMNRNVIRLSPDGRTLATNTSAINEKDQPVRPLLKLWRIPAAW